MIGLSSAALLQKTELVIMFFLVNLPIRFLMCVALTLQHLAVYIIEYLRSDTACRTTEHAALKDSPKDPEDDKSNIVTQSTP